MTHPTPVITHLSDAHCGTCGKLLARLRLEAESEVRIKCKRCRQITTFAAAPTTERRHAPASTADAP
jgi:phage FluMu protein Com